MPSHPDRVRRAYDEEFLIVTPEQYKKGWMEMRGVIPIHHDFMMVNKTEDGNYLVRAPKVTSDR